MKRKKAKLESELFFPLKEYFSDMDYEVHGEVNSCDVIAIKESSIIALELKLKFTLKLVYQCLERKKITDEVYAVIESPKGGLYSKDSKRMINLLKRLEIGLFFISFYESGVKVDKLLDPVVVPIRKNARKKASLLKEIDERSGSYNIGGSRGAHISAFKEASIHVAVIISIYGELSAKEIKAIGGPDKTSTILIKNYHGWFSRIRRGVYVLENEGIDFIKKHPEIYNYYLDKYRMNEENSNSVL